MGVTSQSINTIEKVLSQFTIKSVCDLGAQNDYSDEVVKTNPGSFPYISEWWKSKGVQYTSIDISGENGSLKEDLSKPISINTYFDLVCDFGTSEHVRDYYQVTKNIHKLCKVGGIIIREVPLIDNWPEHGFHYVNEQFFENLAKLNDYKILEMKTEAAMGNVTDGWNIVCVMQKVSSHDFIDRNSFPEHLTFTDKDYERSQEWIYNPRK